MTEEEATARRKHEANSRKFWGAQARARAGSQKGFTYDVWGHPIPIMTEEGRAIERGKERAKHEKAAKDRGERPTEQELRESRGRGRRRR